MTLSGSHGAKLIDPKTPGQGGFTHAENRTVGRVASQHRSLQSDSNLQTHTTLFIGAGSLRDASLPFTLAPVLVGQQGSVDSYLKSNSSFHKQQRLRSKSAQPRTTENDDETAIRKKELWAVPRRDKTRRSSVTTRRRNTCANPTTRTNKEGLKR